MAVKINNRKVIPDILRFIRGEKSAESVTFAIPISEFGGRQTNLCKVRLIQEYADGVVNCKDLDFITDETTVSAEWTPNEDDTAKNGRTRAQVGVYSEDGEFCRLSEIFTIEIGDSVESVEDFTRNVSDALYAELKTQIEYNKKTKQNVAEVKITADGTVNINGDEYQVVTACDGKEYYLGETERLKISCELTEVGATAFIAFDSGNTAPSMIYDGGEPIWVGADCENGDFIPLAYKHYETLFTLEKNGVIYGRVNAWEGEDNVI